MARDRDEDRDRNNRSGGGDNDRIPGDVDPSYDAERRAIARGFEDLLKDLKLDKKYARQDWRTAREDILLNQERGEEDLGTQLARGLLGIRYQRQDIGTDRRRANQDFHLQLTDLGRQFSRTGFDQGQAINAGGGMVGGGQARAAAARREQNYQYERRPLEIARNRMAQDTRRSLGRLGEQRGDIREDYNTNLLRLGEDTQHDIRLGRIDFRRDMRDIRLERQRAEREAAISRADLLAQAIWASQNN